MPPPSGPSCDGTMLLFLAGVFGTASFCLDIGTGGGGIAPLISTSSSGRGSLKGIIVDGTTELDPDAIRRVRPACFRVLPDALLTSGMFSFTLDLRVPTSGYGLNESAAPADSVPEGSTKIWRRPFEPRRDPDVDLRVSA